MKNSSADSRSRQVLFAISNNASMGISHHPLNSGFLETTELSCLKNRPESRFCSIQRVIYESAENASGQLVAKLLSCEIFKNMNSVNPKRKIGCAVTYFDAPHDTVVYASGSFPGIDDSFSNRISNDFRHEGDLTCYNNLHNIVSYVRRKASSAAAVTDTVIFLSLNYQQQLEDVVQLARYSRCFVNVVIRPDLTETSAKMWKKLEELKSATLFPFLCTEVSDIRRVGGQIAHQIGTRKTVTEDMTGCIKDSSLVKLKFGSMRRVFVKVGDNDGRTMRITDLEICGFLDTQKLDEELKCLSFDCQTTVTPVAAETGGNLDKKIYSRGCDLLSLLSHGMKENGQSTFVKIKLASSGKPKKTQRHGLLFPCDVAPYVLQLSVFPDNGSLDRWQAILKYKIGIKQGKRKSSNPITKNDFGKKYEWDTAIQVSRSLLNLTKCARGVVSNAPKNLEVAWKSLSTHCRLLGHHPDWLTKILEDFERTSTDAELRQLISGYLQEVRSGFFA